MNLMINEMFKCSLYCFFSSSTTSGKSPAMEVACGAETAMPPSPVMDVATGLAAERPPLPERAIAAGLAWATLGSSASLTVKTMNG